MDLLHSVCMADHTVLLGVVRKVSFTFYVNVCVCVAIKKLCSTANTFFLVDCFSFI